MTEKTYSQEALIEMCRLEGTPKDAHTLGVADVCALVLLDEGVYFSLGDGFFNLLPSEQEASTGYPRLKPQETPYGRLYGLPGPLLSFPFTAAQLLELDQRTGGVFSERLHCGDETDELIAEIAQRNPRAAELARAVIYRELPPEHVEKPAPEADSASSAPETKEQRQDRRLQSCIDDGLAMDTKDALLRLPDGVGKVAEREGVKRQTYSADVKAALKRRESARREGATVHRV